MRQTKYETKLCAILLAIQKKVFQPPQVRDEQKYIKERINLAYRKGVFRRVEEHVWVYRVPVKQKDKKSHILTFAVQRGLFRASKAHLRT